MISRTGGRYWATGITVVWSERAHTINGQPHAGWGASLDFFDDGFVGDEGEEGELSTQGTLRTRYFARDGKGVSGLTRAVETLIADAEKIGIDFKVADDESPRLYYKGDGENPEFTPPQGWRQTLQAEAKRLGWATYATK